MEFTPQELKLIAKLREQERRWPRRRWILLGMAAFSLVVYGVVAHYLFSTLDFRIFSPADSAMLVAVCWPIILPMVLVAGAFLALAIRDWQENVQRMLLLKLLDAQEATKDKDGKVD
jgi:hypothetical protein